jgi:hypothetical protein
MTTNLIPSPVMQFFDANGVPLVGGKLYTYAAGTTTPLATYTDSTGATANTNPVILDSRGEAAVWCDDSEYYMELKDSTNVLIWTADNINGSNGPTLAALAASGGSALIGFLQAGTGAVARTVQSKLRDTASVTDFGAVGDGTTNDTPAFNTAFTAELGGMCLIPGTGSYKLSAAPNNVNTGIMSMGATFVTNLPPGSADDSVFGKSAFILQKYLGTAGSATFLAGNQFVNVAMAVTPTYTGSTGSYEKAATFSRIEHNDNSDYGTSPQRLLDAVGTESQVILKTTATGRGWAYHGLTQVDPSCDGFTNGIEVEMINDSTVQTDPQNEQTSKNGVQVVAARGIGTKAIGIIGQPLGGAYGSWANGIVFYPTSINANGPAMIIPSMSPVSIWKYGAYPTLTFGAFFGDTSDNLVVGYGATAISMATPVNCVQGLNTTVAYITAAAPAGATTELVLGNSTAATAGAIAGYLNIYIGATARKIAYYAV